MSLEVFIQFFIYSPYGPAYGCDNAMGESDGAIGQKDETIAQSDGKTGQERTKKEHSDLAIGKDDGRQNKAMRRQEKKQLSYLVQVFFIQLALRTHITAIYIYKPTACTS